MDLKTSKKIMAAAVEALRTVFEIQFEEAGPFLERRVVSGEGEPFFFKTKGRGDGNFECDFEFDVVSRPSGLVFRMAIPAGSLPECGDLAKDWVTESWQLLHGAFGQKASFYAVEKAVSGPPRLIYKMPKDGPLGRV